MKRFAYLGAGIAALLSLAATAANAQAVPRAYQKGTVSLVIAYQIKPGKLNTFMQEFAAHLRPGLEIGKKTGGILGYSIQQPLDARAGDPTLFEIITFKDLASFDRSYAVADQTAIAVYGSLDAAAAAGAKRAEYATQVSNTLTRELAPLP